jgi:NAD-dependent dihydropyrimidine dehydrogenase PreA subunit
VAKAVQSAKADFVWLLRRSGEFIRSVALGNAPPARAARTAGDGLAKAGITLPQPRFRSPGRDAPRTFTVLSVAQPAFPRTVVASSSSDLHPTHRSAAPPLFRFLRRTPAEPASARQHSGADESSANEGREGEGPGTLVTITGSGAVEAVRGPLPTDAERLRLLARGLVEAVAGRCVQCGICSYNCPMGIDVRSYSREARPVLESHCILCGECVARCPRGVLRFALPGGDA